VNASERYLYDNATLICALELIFTSLEETGVPTLQLSEIASTTSGGTPNRSVSANFGGSIPWVKSGELNDGVINHADESITECGLASSSAKVFPIGSILVALYGATVGKTGVLAIEAATNQAVCAVTPREGRVSAEYLHWFLRYKRRDFVKASFGGAQPNISQSILRQTIIPVPSSDMQNAFCRFFDTVARRQEGDLIDDEDLPEPFESKRKIVSHIQKLSLRIEEARALRQSVDNELALLCRSVLMSAACVRTPMHEIVSLRCPDVKVDASEIYSFAGVYCFGRGVFSGNTKSGTEFAYSSLTRVNAGEFVYPKLMAWEGALGIVPPECDGLVVSPEFPVFTVNTDRVLPEVLDVYFRSPEVWPRLAEISTGTNVRRRRLHPSAFLKYEIPLPSLGVQNKLRKIKKHADAVRSHRESSSLQFDALLPSILDKAF